VLNLLTDVISRGRMEEGRGSIGRGKQLLGKQTLCQLSYSRSGRSTLYRRFARGTGFRGVYSLTGILPIGSRRLIRSPAIPGAWATQPPSGAGLRALSAASNAATMPTAVAVPAVGPGARQFVGHLFDERRSRT
jgi:hypothetical protein